MRLTQAVEALQEGRSVTLRPHGNSMTPLIHSGDSVDIRPLTPAYELKKGMAVLCKVKGRLFVHLIHKVGDDGRYLIGNNHGHENGWTRNIYGVVTRAEDRLLAPEPME